MLVIADPSEWSETARVRGTGGWIDPRKREALDWATLGRLMGWSVTVGLLTDPLEHPRLMEGSAVVIFACDAADVTPQMMQFFMRRLIDEPLLIVMREGTAQTRELVGRGAIVRIGIHPSVARDAGGVMTRHLQHLLVHESMRPVAWLDHSGTVVLRMDDPGGAQNVHWDRWYSRKLTEAEWNEVGAELRRRDGRLSIGYISQWVDDGDAARGDLTVDGQKPARMAGAIHDSSRIIYVDRHGHHPDTVHDYVSESCGISALKGAGLSDVELHGRTHMHPDLEAWVAAADKFGSVRWYRELGHDKALTQRSLELGIESLERQFGTRPTTLVCPGDEWTNDMLERALEQDIQLVGSYYLAIRDDASFWWCTHVCAPYFDQPDAAWFESPLPVVGYCHDRDLVLNGVEWWRDCIEGWHSAGARRFIDYRQLASELSHRLEIDAGEGDIRLRATSVNELPLVKPLEVCVRCPTGQLPKVMGARVDGRDLQAHVHRVDDTVGRLVLGP